MILFEFKALNLHLIHPLFDHWWIKLYYKPDVLHFANQYGDLLGRYIFMGASAFIPPLWTMQAELNASCACFVFFRFLNNKQHRLAAMPVLALLILTMIPLDRATLYLAFILGVVLWEIKTHLTIPNWFATVLLGVGCLLGGMSQFLKPDNSFYPMLLGSFAEFLRGNILIVWTGAATLIVLAILCATVIQTVLQSKICQFLGRISFSLYLVHFPILGSLAASLYLSFGQNSTLGLCTVLAIYLAVVFIVATIFEAVVDRNAVAFSKSLRKSSLGGSQPAIAS
jgi:peptidoglycan/LPS O-acetylase OafA/YrhL